MQRVGWTRGDGCRELAHLLAEAPVPLQDHLRRQVISHRIELVVMRALSSFDLVSVAVPAGFSTSGVEGVIGAVGSGPHSPLAASVAITAAASLGVPATLVTVHRANEAEEATARLRELSGGSSESVAIESTSMRPLLDLLTPATPLVVGAPGGWWLSRQLLGTGHRLTSRAPGGTIIVRWAERRVFHESTDAVGVALGPEISAGDALRLMKHPVVPVAEDGRLVGLARRVDLEAMDAAAPVSGGMDEPVALHIEEALTSAADLVDHLEGAPIPVVDGDGLLVGLLDATDRVP